MFTSCSFTGRDCRWRPTVYLKQVQCIRTTSTLFITNFRAWFCVQFLEYCSDAYWVANNTPNKQRAQEKIYRWVYICIYVLLTFKTFSKVNSNSGWEFAASTYHCCTLCRSDTNATNTSNTRYNRREACVPFCVRSRFAVFAQSGIYTYIHCGTNLWNPESIVLLVKFFEETPEPELFCRFRFMDKYWFLLWHIWRRIRLKSN